MKGIFTTLSVFAFLFTVQVSQAQPHMKEVWATDTVLAIPESVYADGKILYASLIDGKPWDKDGKGGIARLSADGKILTPNWITGLNSPKGMVKHGAKLYVADMDEVVVIDITKGKVENKIAIKGAKWLNDITIDTKGVLYVTDSANGMVFEVINGAAHQYLDSLKGLNGIKWVNSFLYIVTGDGLYKVESNKTLTKLAVIEKGGDGIEPIGNGDWLVTSWSGYVYYVHANGKTHVLLDTHDKGKQTADIGYDAKKKIVYVPTFFGKSVVAYQLDFNPTSSEK